MTHAHERYAIFGVVLVLAVVAGCRSNTSEAIDAADLVGKWELTSNGETEWFDLAEGGTFKATINRDGFIATTLAQGPHVSVEGTWQLSDHTLTFKLERSTEAALVGQSHSYRIIELTDRAMHTLNERGTKKTLLRGTAGRDD